MTYLAHTENENGQTHKLDEHLKRTGELARKFAVEANPQLAEAAAFAGLLHDAGKYRDEFQRYLIDKVGKRGDVETHHAAYGAYLGYALKSFALAFAIAGHHAGLHDASGLQELFKTPAYNLPHSLEDIKARLTDDLNLTLAPMAAPSYKARDSRADVYVRMLFSMLVDADFLDTEAHYKTQARTSVELKAEALLEKVVAAKNAKSVAARAKTVEHELIDERDRIFAACLEAANDEQGFFSLTVPTGGGKTLSSAAFALAHAVKHDLRRVVVVIPYLSIIEQNAAELRRILDPKGEGIIIESHSAVATKDANSANEIRDYAELAAENWDAPVVVTTAVQFIESLFANKPSRCRKLHNIARSVVILDEAQMLPVHLLNPLLSVMRELQARYGVSFVFSTATQPAFRKAFNALDKGFLDGEVTEITTDTANTFQRLARVSFELPRAGETRSWASVSDEMLAASQALCVVNTRSDARTLFNEIKRHVPDNVRDAVFHLSSAMCAEHRLHIIGEMHEPRAGSVRHRLLQGEPCCVVSTQLVEAGVDLDFPLVMRALAPLDSIVQAAGRCNRENNLRDEDGNKMRGRVIVFRTEEGRLPGKDYKTRTDITATMLSRLQPSQLTDDPQIFADYFQQVFQTANTDVSHSDEDKIEYNREQLNFRKVAQAARVIRDEGTSCIAPYGDAVDIIRDIREREQVKGKPRFTREDLRRLQRFIINLHANDFLTLQTMGQISELLPNLELYVLNEGSYDNALGVVIGERSSEDFNR